MELKVPRRNGWGQYHLGGLNVTVSHPEKSIKMDFWRLCEGNSPMKVEEPGKADRCLWRNCKRKAGDVKLQDLALQSLAKPESKPVMHMREKSQDIYWQATWGNCSYVRGNCGTLPILCLSCKVHLSNIFSLTKVFKPHLCALVDF